jgi:hypothetical protein
MAIDLPPSSGSPGFVWLPIGAKFTVVHAGRFAIVSEHAPVTSFFKNDAGAGIARPRSPGARPRAGEPRTEGMHLADLKWPRIGLDCCPEGAADGCRP